MEPGEIQIFPINSPQLLVSINKIPVIIHDTKQRLIPIIIALYLPIYTSVISPMRRNNMSYVPKEMLSSFTVS